MRIQLASDLHLEWYDKVEGKVRGQEFIDSCDPTDVDVLVLAGDICNANDCASTLKAFVKHGYKNVVYVNGNHEPYGLDFHIANKLIKDAGRVKGVHVLMHNSVTIDGVKFAGTPLWFEEKEDNPGYEFLLADFRHIKNYAPSVYRENEKAREFLYKEVDERTVVVTHHLPSHECVGNKWKTSALNRFFVCDLHTLIEERQPKLWLFGHTHDSTDVKIDKTRLVANPFGYIGYELNREFDPKLILEV